MKRYIIKCDDCKREIGQTDELMESAAGGRCEECRRRGQVIARSQVRGQGRAAR